MRYTHLEMVQTILETMKSDTVNTWDETVESETVGKEVRRVFYEFILRLDPAEFRGMQSLTALGDTTKPTHFLVPETVSQIEEIKYDCNTTTTASDLNYKTIRYVDPMEFYDMCSSRVGSAANSVIVVDHSGKSLIIRNDAMPSVWTCLGDDYVVFDSYDSSIEATMQSGKLIAFGSNDPVYTMGDTYVPELNSRYFPAFLAECTSACFNNIKEQPNALEARRARTGASFIQNERSKVVQGYGGPNFGRRHR